MANEEVVVDLLARLKADAEQYFESMQQAINLSQMAEHEVTASHAAMQEAQEAGIRIASLMGEMIEGAYKRVIAVAKESLVQWQQQAEANIELTALLHANGRAAEATFESYTRLADEIQNAGIAADNYVLSLTKQAEAQQLTGSAAEVAVRQAIAIQQTGEASAEAALRVASALAEGDIKRAKALSRSIRALRGVKDEEEFLHRFRALVDAGLEAGAAKVETYAGQWNKLDLQFQQIQEDFGRLISGPLTAILHWVNDAVQAFRELPDSVRYVIATFGLLTVALFAVSAAVVFLKGQLGMLILEITVLALSTPIGQFILLTTIILGLAAAFYAATPAVQEYNAAIKRAEELQRKWIAQFQEETVAIIAEGKAIKDAADQKKFFTDATEMAEKELKTYQGTVKRLQAEVEKLSKTTDDFVPPWERPVGEPAGLAEAKHDLEEAKQALEVAKDKADQLRDALQNLEKARISKLKEDMEEFIEKTKEAAKVVGKTAEEAKLFKFEERLKEVGPNPELEAALATAKAEAEKLKLAQEVNKEKEKAAQHEKRTAESAKQLTESLRDQLQALESGIKLSAEQKAINKLGREGAKEEQLAEAQSLADAIEKHKKEQELQKDRAEVMEKAFKDAEREQKKLEDEAKSIEQRYMTDAERKEQELQKLQDLRDKGIIDEEKFLDLKARAEKGKEKKGGAADKVEAATFGSAKALSIIQDIRGAQQDAALEHAKNTAKNTEHIADLMEDVADAFAGGQGLIPAGIAGL